MGKFLDCYIQKLEVLPPVRMDQYKPPEIDTTAGMPFYQVLDNTIIDFVRSRNQNMIIPDIKEFFYEFCTRYPIRESELKARVEMLKRNGWRH